MEVTCKACGEKAAFSKTIGLRQEPQTGEYIRFSNDDQWIVSSKYVEHIEGIETKSILCILDPINSEATDMLKDPEQLFQHGWREA